MPFKVPEQVEREIDKRLTYYPQRRSAVLPALHAIQHHFRYITDEAVEWLARKLGLEPIQVLEVVTFYPGFRQTAPGKYHIRVCRTLSCAMAGSDELMDALAKAAGIDRSKADYHHPIALSKDGRFSIEFAECLASCGSGPVCMVEDELLEEVDPKKATNILANYS